MGAERLTRREAVAAGVAAALAPGVAAARVNIRRELTLRVDGRAVPVVLMTGDVLPRSPAPLLVLSHGANGTLGGLAPLMNTLCGGRIVAAPQHTDSEDNPDAAKADRMALSGQRAADVRAVIDAAPEIERAFGIPGLRLDRTHVAVAGHSFGALIAQALGGALMQGRSFRDPRVTRVIAISPPGPFPGLCDAAGWAKLEVPQLVTTGTADVLPGFAPTWDVHAASFEAARVPGSALWVGKGVDHYFGRNIQRLTREAPDQSAAFLELLRLTEAFLSGEQLRPDPALTERFETI